MTYNDWTHVAPSYASISLDYAIKKEGAASLKHYSTALYWNTCTSTRKNYSVKQMRVILYVRLVQTSGSGGTGASNWVSHPSYAGLTLQSMTLGGTREWEKFRASFWYDAVLNTRFARVEKEVNGEWQMVGGDVNCGAGPPNAGSCTLGSTIATWTYKYGAAWFDVVEVYSAAL